MALAAHRQLLTPLISVLCRQVLDLMAKDLEHMGQMTCDVKKARWARILDALRLSRPQQDALLLLRKQHLKKLHDVYEQRQRLNMQVRTLSPARSHAMRHHQCLCVLCLQQHVRIWFTCSQSYSYSVE